MSTVRQRITALFDYRGDNARNAGSNSPRVYSSNYSPNNIRTVVISPNGVMVRYHLSVDGHDYKYIEFPERDLYAEEQDTKYKPILRLLADPLICASIEEIIVLSQSLSGTVHPNYMREIQLQSMVASYKGSGTDLQTRITGRYGRLRYYASLSVNFKTFMGYFLTVKRSGELKRGGLLCELKEIKRMATIQPLAGEDYWRYYGYQATYAYDMQLREHFEKIKAKREEDAKSKAVDEMRDKRVGGKVKAINEMIEEYSTCSKLWARFYNIAKSEGLSGITNGFIGLERPETIHLFKFKGMVDVPEEGINPATCSEAEALERDEAMLKGYKLKFAKAVVGAFILSLDDIASRGETILLKTIVAGCDTTMAVPPQYGAAVSRIAQMTGVKFEGRDIDTSIVNSCSMFMKYFVACRKSEPYDKEYWGSRLRKVVRA